MPAQVASRAGLHSEAVELGAQAAPVYRIFSPGLDQAMFLATLLKRHSPGSRRVGVRMPGEMSPLSARLYDEVIPLEGFDPSDSTAIEVPSGGQSTRMFLEQGGLSLGEVVMSPDSLRFFDKEWSIAQAEMAGIATPSTSQDAEAIGRFPVFFKPAFEGGEAARGLARDTSQIPRVARGKLIFQEFIDSPGTYGVGFVASGGEMLVHFVHYEVESQPRTGGSAILLERFEDQRLIDQTRVLLRQTGYSGWGLVEFKFCPHRKDYVFMELNAKFWASCEFAFRNEPEFARRLFGIDTPRQPLERMVFMGRAFGRGLGAVPFALSALRSDTRLRFYPGWQYHLLAGLLPRGVKNWLTRIRKGGVPVAK
jgi:hypothetical protein